MKTILFTYLLCILYVQISNAQWVQVSNGIGNVDVRSLAYSGNNIFAGTNGYGVYLSTNSGTSWTQTSLNIDFVGALAVNGDNVFACTFNNGLYSSTNNGTNWTQALGGQFRSLAINGSNIFAGCANPIGLYLSTNNGATWSLTSLNNRDVLSFAVNGIYIFAGTISYGVYLSTDNGTSWTQTSLNNRSVNSLAVNGNTIFAGTTLNGVYVSTDNGASWTQTSLNNRTVGPLGVNGSNIFAGTTIYGVYVSINNGTSWEQRNEGLGNLYVRALCILNNYVFAGTENSLYRRPIGELTDIQPISNEVPNSFSLSQNYPNPFNPSTRIQFALPKSSFATLVIYDITGRELETIVGEQLNAGTYEADWNADKFSSGVYYYKLTAGRYTETKRMVLIK
jgi:hypothetical protein